MLMSFTISITMITNDYDNDDGLDEGKKKKFDYRQSELFDKTHKKSKLDGETKKD